MGQGVFGKKKQANFCSHPAPGLKNIPSSWSPTIFMCFMLAVADDQLPQLLGTHDLDIF